MNVDWTSILLQAPLVAIFIWFTLRLNEDHQKIIDKIMSDGRAANSQVMGEWRNYLKERDDQWRGFLAEQRAANNDSLDAMADQIRGIAVVVESLDRDVRKVNHFHEAER